MNADSLASRQRQDGCYCEEDIEKILFDREAIERRVREMGRQITEDYRERARCQGGEGEPRLLVVSVLRGAAIFMADLARAIELPIEMDYMAISSYGNGAKSSGVVRILKDLDVDYTIGIDEAAFYGPKLDIQYKNVYGKEDTLVTIQIDMLLAERFGMYYIDENGEKKLPYIIHRTSLGCYERTLAYLIEEYAGALPTWMAPEQVRFLPVTDRANEYCEKVAAQLEEQGFRTEVDYRNEKIGRKIRDAQTEKVPYMVIVGDRDMENGTVSPRHRADGDLGAMSVDEFSALLKRVVDNKEQK